MKYSKNNAITVSPDSTKYFYVYEIDCDGVIIPFNPKYLIPYLMNDQFSITSYSGDVYKSVRGTYGMLGGNSHSESDSAKLEFKLTLKVETIRISIKELVDIVYSNYSFDTLEEMKKLILVASCSKAMMISLLYLIFYNLIDTENDLEKLSKLEYNDLYDYVLNKLKMNCLTENPLKTNFGSYVDIVVGATAELSDSDDFCPVYEQEVAAIVNKDVYQNIYKFSGTSLQYDKDDINESNKLSNDTTTWGSELQYLLDSGYISTSIDSDGYKKYKLDKALGLDTDSVIYIDGHTLYNNSKHLTIKLENHTVLKCSSELYSETEWAQLTEDVILTPGQSKDLSKCMKLYYYYYYYPWYFGYTYMSTFLSYLTDTVIEGDQYICIKEYNKNLWYSSLTRDLNYNLLSLDNDSVVEVLENTTMNYSADIIINVDSIGSYDLDFLSLLEKGEIYNHSDLYVTIPAGIPVDMEWRYFGLFFYYGYYSNIGNGRYVTNEMVIPPKSSIKISLTKADNSSEIDYWLGSNFDINNYLNNISNIRLYDTHELKFHISTSEESTLYTSDAVVKPVDLLLFGNSAENIDSENHSVTVKGIAKANTDDYKKDFYWLDMTVAGISGSEYASQLRTETMSINNAVAYNDDLSVSKGIDSSIVFDLQTSDTKRIFPIDINEKPSVSYFTSHSDSLAYTNLLVENDESRLTVAPTGLLISSSKTVGLTHRPRLKIKTDSRNLEKKENVEKLIDQLFIDNTSTKYNVPTDQKDVIIHITKIKYKPKVRVDFYVNNSDTETVETVFNDIQFLLNMSDITLDVNNTEYATDITAAQITAVSLPTEIGSGTSSDLTLNQYKTFNTAKYTALANSNTSKLLLAQIELTAPDLRKTVDISAYGIYLYNGVLYRGSEMNMAG